MFIDSYTADFYPFCPTEDFTCPYYNEGLCLAESPAQECIDYLAYYEEIQNDLP